MVGSFNGFGCFDIEGGGSGEGRRSGGRATLDVHVARKAARGHDGTMARGRSAAAVCLARSRGRRKAIGPAGPQRPTRPNGSCWAGVVEKYGENRRWAAEENWAKNDFLADRRIGILGCRNSI
jgi:hypothetical protein